MITTLTKDIKTKAIQLGFDACGISPVNILYQEKTRIEKWIKEKKHGNMLYLSKNIDKKTNPILLVPNAKTIISLLLNYYPEQKQNDESFYKVSKYAYSKDYHIVIKEKLNNLIQYIKEKTNTTNIAAFVDACPVLEKLWASKSGLGAIGKNSLLINKKFGSYFFIAEIITDVELNYDIQKTEDLCAGCDCCIKACPTGAIEKSHTINASKCISYLTIESKTQVAGTIEQWIYGCDICQDVCPWNKKLIPTKETAFKVNTKLIAMKKKEWEHLSNEQFEQFFANSAIHRIGYDKLMKNIKNE